MSNILTGFNMQGNDPIDNRIVSPSKFETLEEYLQRVPIQKRYYGLSFYALDENNELRHYTFQTSLIEPTIDDDEEEIERLDKELQEHVNNKEIHKTSEEIRSEIVDADIPDTIARVQWTLDQIKNAVDTVMGDIVDGASDEYNTLKKIQDKIVELRTEVESQLYGDDGGEVLKTLEQALKFLNQYKDFIVDIPDNYVNKQDIVDNLNTDDPTKVLSARQGKVLSETLTNYFDSAMASIRAETNRAIGAENRIEAKLDDEIDRSTAEDIRIQSELDAEEARAQSEEKRIEDKLDAEIERSTTKDTELENQIIAETERAEGEEQRIETKLDNEITRSTAKDEEHDDRIKALEGDTHVQNTDVGTTSQTFQLQLSKPGNKIKNEDAAISVRNAADTDYVNFIAKNATFKGDLLVEGQSFVTEAETIEIKDNLLLLNKGEVGAGVTKGIAGLEIDRGTEPNYQIIFDESDNRFKAGEIGDIQCLALRDGDGDMLDGMFTTWDSTTHRLKTTNIIPSNRKLFFNTNINSLGFASQTYNNSIETSYTVDSFVFTGEKGNFYINAGETYLNIDTNRTKFKFYKDLVIPSSIQFGNTSFSLLGANGTAIATFGSPSTINSSLNVANQVIIKGGSDTKLILQSSDANNFNLIESQNSSGTILSKLGYYGTFWGIDNKKIATEEFANNKFLPLAGGTMTGNIQLPDATSTLANGNISTTVGESLLSWTGNNVYISTNSHSTYIRSGATNLMHVRNGISYTIYDSYNFNPGNYLPLTGGTLTGKLRVKSGGSNLLILDSSSSTESAIHFLRSSTSKGGVGYYDNIGAFIYNFPSSTYLFVKDDGKPYVGKRTDYKKILTETDITGYATQSWTTSNFYPLAGKGYLSFDGSGRPVMSNNQGYSVKDSTGTAREVLWMSPGNILNLGQTSAYTLAGINIIATSVAINNSEAATQSWVNSQGFLKSASDYLPLSGGKMSGSITIPGNKGQSLVVTANESSNYVSGVVYKKGNTSHAAMMGYHSTGGTNEGTGAIILVPYPTDTNAWSKTVGLYIAKNELLLDGNAVATQTWVSNQGFLKTTPSITISNSGSGNAVTAITASGHTLTVTKGATYLTSSSLSGYATQSWVTSQGYLTSSSLSGYATQTWVNNKNYAVRKSDNVLIAHSNEFNFTDSSNTSIAINYRGGSGSNTSAAINNYTFYNGQNSKSGVKVEAETFVGALSGNATTATTASKLGSSTVGGTAKPIYLSSGTATACSATVGSSTVPVYMSSGTITQCSTTLGVSITGNAATATTATNSNNLGGYAAATYVKSTSTTKVQDIQVVTTAGSTTGVLYVVLES